MTGADWFRVGLFLVASFDAGSVVTVLGIYFWTWWRSPAHQTRLPLHIWSIALRDLGLLVIVACIIWTRIGNGLPLSTIAIAYACCVVVGIFSMVKIGAQQIERLRGIRG